MKMLSKLNQLLKYKEPDSYKCFKFYEDENEDQGPIDNISIDNSQDPKNDQSKEENGSNKSEQSKKRQNNKKEENNPKENIKNEDTKRISKFETEIETKENEPQQEDIDKKSKKQIRELKKPIEVSNMNLNGKNDSKENQAPEKITHVLSNIETNKKKLESEFNVPTNQDVVIRNFKIKGKKDTFIIYVDGMIDKDSVNDFILRQLMNCNSLNDDINKGNKDDNKESKEDINIDYICNNLLAINQIKKETEFEKIVPQILNGLCALFVEGDTSCVLIETRGYEKRSVSTPQTESVIKGSHEAFVENLRTNLTLVRRIIRNKNLITEILPAGKIDNVSCAIVYMKGIANPKVIEEVKNRINSLDVDFIPGGGIMDQLIEDHPLSMIPQVLTTERPDRTASMLMQGHVAIISDGTPSSSIVPITFFNMMHTTEDMQMRFPYGLFLRTLRFLTILIALTVPGLYAALNLYHQEMIPTELLMSLYGTRQNTPFPIVLEILLMELSFEIIREAGVRVPGVVGQTLGIIGAIVLGQAAVSAQLVSPALIIVVAITGLCGFAVPTQSLSFGVRISRFLFTIMGAIAGFYGISLTLFVYTAYHASLKSFGVPIFSPVAPKMNSGYTEIVRGPVSANRERPDYLNTGNRTKNRQKSRGWDTKKEEGDK